MAGSLTQLHAETGPEQGKRRGRRPGLRRASSNSIVARFVARREGGGQKRNSVLRFAIVEPLVMKSPPSPVTNDVDAPRRSREVLRISTLPIVEDAGRWQSQHARALSASKPHLTLNVPFALAACRRGCAKIATVPRILCRRTGIGLRCASFGRCFRLVVNESFCRGNSCWACDAA